MAWHSRLGRFEEVPTFGNVIPFRHPVRATAAGAYVVSLILFSLAYMVSRMADRDVWPIIALLPAAGGLWMAGVASWLIFVTRHIEVIPALRALFVVRRPFLRKASRTEFPFAGMRRIAVTSRVDSENPAEATLTIVIEMSDGRHVDLGGMYSTEQGYALARRMSQLTGAHIESA